ncbi:MAG: putative DNA binding domain-containing protein [Propionibacteriaceae bacterium]|jgi:ATP-dependent DNA helicase RecG|nr:putative DNA binding domain-containing protein [Propionibacteriaceae bacterium]
MVHESHTREFKSSWRDEWLKWICGFANSQGGVLEVGKNDDGEAIGLKGARQLLEDVPNKITSTMGIVADVDVRIEDGLSYLVITVQPCPNAISYRGKYYIRSGATNRELTGNALSEFLLRKVGRSWDSVPMPHIEVSDLSAVALREFRRMAVARQRLTQDDVDINDPALIDSLHLREGDYLTRAAALLFHSDPERWFTGCFVKIGFFRTGSDLMFHDEVHGPLITLTDKVIDLLYTKYLMAIISYEGIYRRETFPVPEPACREAILNAIVHKDYSSGIPIQIRVYPDQLVIGNAGSLPDGWTVEKLTAPHTSMPRNPDIARVVFRSGQIEAWGRGIQKIEEVCAGAGMPQPAFTATASDVSLALSFAAGNPLAAHLDDDVRVSVRVNVRVTPTQQTILNHMAADSSVTTIKLAEIIGITERRVRSNIKTLKDTGLVTRSGSDKSGQWIVNPEVSDD